MVSLKNIEYFSRKRSRRVKENAIFGPQNGDFGAFFRLKKLYFYQFGAKTCLKVVSDLVSRNYAAVGPNFCSFHMKNYVFHRFRTIFTKKPISQNKVI